MAAIWAVAALCVATKLPGTVLGALLVLTMAIRIRFFERSAVASQAGVNLWILLILLGIMGFAAMHSYGFAYWVTDNPVFPLYNKIFKSAFFPAWNFSDGRWTKGFNPITYVNVFFNTSEFFESKNYVAGFQYLLLLPLALFAVWRRQVPRHLLLLLVPLLGFGLVIFQATQYWRYLFPVMPLACVITTALLLPTGGLIPSLARGLVVACTVLNFFFFPGVSWMFTVPLQSMYTEPGRNELSRSWLGEKTITSRLNQEAPGARVLYLF